MANYSIVKNWERLMGNYTIVKYGEIFDGNQMALTPAAVKIDRVFKESFFESNDYSHKIKNSWCHIFLASLARFCKLGLISDLHIIFQKSWNGPNYYAGPKHIYYIILKYDETFNGRHTALTPDVVKIN